MQWSVRYNTGWQVSLLMTYFWQIDVNMSVDCFPYNMFLQPLQKRAYGIPLNTIEYHSVSFSTIGPFNGISVGLGGAVNGNLK